MPTAAPPALPPDVVAGILSHLDLPPSPTLPTPPLAFLAAHLAALPASLLAPFSPLVDPRARAAIPLVKSRRLLYASCAPPPPELTAERGRLRWPVLWERLGGARELPPPSAAQRDEEAWVRTDFMGGKEGTQHVRKLGALLREDQEAREWEDVRRARREEYRLDQVGEEFDEESDEEAEGDEGDGGGSASRATAPVVNPDQAAVKQLFERQLLELFLDGKDTVDYDDVDYNEPEGGDPIGERDEADRYFDDEEPSRTPGGTHVDGAGARGDGESLENGDGDYDY